MMQLLTSILVTLYIPPTRLQAYKEFRWLRPASVVQDMVGTAIRVRDLIYTLSTAAYLSHTSS